MKYTAEEKRNLKRILRLPRVEDRMIQFEYFLDVFGGVEE